MRDWLYPYLCGAGDGAREKYRQASQHWRKRVFRRPWLIAGVFVAPVFVVAIVERHDDPWLWVFGVLWGGFLGGYIAILESPPANIENWRAGFEGERRTARALAPLRRSGFALLHDVPDRRVDGRSLKGNIDHIVVSSGGVFLLDSKWFGGDASITGDTVHVQMRDDEDDSYDLTRLASGMRGAAVRLQEDIKDATDVRFVQPVVVFWNCFAQTPVESVGVVYVHGEHLVAWLEEQRGAMTAGWVARVAACIAQIRPSEHRTWRARLPAAHKTRETGPVDTIARTVPPAAD